MHITSRTVRSVLLTGVLAMLLALGAADASSAYAKAEPATQVAKVGAPWCLYCVS
jgi:hypothetical protein